MTIDIDSKTPTRKSAHSSNNAFLGSYKIESVRISEPACIWFVRHCSSNERVVLKLVFEHKDSRYNLESVVNRQRCQLEALKWNRIFTPNIYIGLVHICSFDNECKDIVIDEFIEDPSIESLTPNTEYALLMHQLPTSTRLDSILTDKESPRLQNYIHGLTSYIVHIHTNLTNISIPIGEAMKWGGNKQLQKKLMHNLGFLDQIINQGEIDEYSSYYWLKNSLRRGFDEIEHLHYFKQRVEVGRIKRCHADLKAPNIWVAPFPSHGKQNEYWYKNEALKYIYLLDAIDFNPMYSYIDILSDFAMLAIDIHARTNSHKLADSMIENYLKLTDQQDNVSRLVLAYYLVEKAIIGAAVSILFDKMPQVGLNFLEVASLRMNELNRQITIEKVCRIVEPDMPSPTLS